MLSLLHIENIAVIECCDISFDSGFNILTGETGAGKSIVIDAISAILGERAYRDMIRTGTDKASVRAVFTDVPKLQWFEDNGVEYDPETVIQRDIHLDGKNICRVNGSLVSVTILRKLGIQLINIHGQHDSASLFDENNHLQFLDDFASNQALREDYLCKYEAVDALRREIRRMTMDESEKLRRMETLRYQIEEISKAALEPGEDEQLEERRKILQNAEKLSDGMDAAVECLYGGDDSDGAATLSAGAMLVSAGASTLQEPGTKVLKDSILTAEKSAAEKLLPLMEKDLAGALNAWKTTKDQLTDTGYDLKPEGMDEETVYIIRTDLK